MSEAYRFVFRQEGDFEAARAAERFLAAAGFSVGRMQEPEPRGILFGDFDIQKWRNLRPADRAELHGIMEGGRAGPVTVRIYSSAPQHAALKVASSALQPQGENDVG